jgi:hypothetical protein
LEAEVAVLQKSAEEARAAVELTARQRRIMEGSSGSCDNSDDEGDKVDDNGASTPPRAQTCGIEVAAAREDDACCARDKPREATELAATEVL